MATQSVSVKVVQDQPGPELVHINPYAEIADRVLLAYREDGSNAFTLTPKGMPQSVHIALADNKFTGEYISPPNIQWLSCWLNCDRLRIALSIWNIPVWPDVDEWSIEAGANFLRAADIGLFSKNRKDSIAGRILPHCKKAIEEPKFTCFDGKDCIYFIQAKQLGLVKIGVTSKLSKRLSAIKTGCPDELVILKVVPGNQKTEHQIHEKFAKERVRGEWFEMSAGLEQFIKGLPQ